MFWIDPSLFGHLDIFLCVIDWKAGAAKSTKIYDPTLGETSTTERLSHPIDHQLYHDSLFFCPNVLILQEDILLHDLFPFSDICRARRVKIYGDGLDECQQPSLSLLGFWRGKDDHCNDAEEDVFKTGLFFLSQKSFLWIIGLSANWLAGSTYIRQSRWSWSFYDEDGGDVSICIMITMTILTRPMLLDWLLLPCWIRIHHTGLPRAATT